MASRKKKAPIPQTTKEVGENGDEREVMTAEGRYSALETERYPFYRRAQDASKMTIPSLMPPQGHTGATMYYQPFQSVGAEGVNNLAAKLLLALFPPGSSFFRLAISELVLQQLQKKSGNPQQYDQDRSEFEEALAKIEDAVMVRMEQAGTRMALFECFKHLIVCGNALLQILDNGGLKLHQLDRFVVKRDLEGNVVEMVVKETISKLALPAAVLAIITSVGSTGHETSPTGFNDGVDIYTWIRRAPESKMWTIHQEVFGKVVPGSEGTYPMEKSPWLPLRYITVYGEDYGRGFVEENIGSLKSLDALNQCIVEGSAQAAKVLWFINEGGVTTKRKVAQAANGAVLDGNAKDVSALQLDKFADFRVAKETADELKKDLQRAFLLLAGVQRNAERVTAEEIRELAQELETSQGGIYSVMAQELQRPLAVREMFQMQKAGTLPHLPKDLVEPQIVTGIAGLGRNSDLEKYQTLGQVLNEIFPQGEHAEYMDVGATVRGVAVSIDVPGIDAIIKTDDQVNQERQAAQSHEIAKAAVGPGIKAASDAAQSAQPAQPEAA